MALPEQLHSSLPETPQDKCGTLAVFSKTGAAIHEQIPLMLYELHHRGRDSAGESTYNPTNQSINSITGEGSAGHVFHIKKDKQTGEKVMQMSLGMQMLISDRGIGHVRYGTSGDEHKDTSDGTQPMTAEWNGRKITVAFNGNIPLPEREKLQSRIAPDLTPGKFDTSDIVQAIVSADGETWEDRIRNGMDGIKGAYSLNILTDTGEVFGLRGPSGHWPLMVGESEDLIAFSSESVVDPNLQWSEVNPGELVKATPQGVERKQLFTPEETFSCLLHDAYGARGESLWRGEKTYQHLREQLGEKLAELFPIDADYYDGIPNTGRMSARGYTRALNVSMTEIFQVLSDAERSYNAKNPEASLHVIKGKFKLNQRLIESGALIGKSVVLTDDSMIKGATHGGDLSNNGEGGIIKYLREQGVSEVHLLLSLPKFVNDCDLGYVVNKDLLIAVEKDENGNTRIRSDEEIARIIGADSIHFMPPEAVKEIYGPERPPCMACMGAEHPFYGIQERTIFMRPVPFDKAQDIGTMSSVAAD